MNFPQLQNNWDNFVSEALRTESVMFPFEDYVYETGLTSRTFHSVLGVSTELVEMKWAKDIVNFIEEVGDIYWYLAIMYDDLKIQGFEIDIDNYFKDKELEYFINQSLEMIEVDLIDEIIQETKLATFMEIVTNELLSDIKASIFYLRPFDEHKLSKSFYLLKYFTDMIVFGLNFYVDIDKDGTNIITIEEVQNKVINKLKVRYPEKFEKEKANNRNLDKEYEALKK